MTSSAAYLNLCFRGFFRISKGVFMEVLLKVRLKTLYFLGFRGRGVEPPNHPLDMKKKSKYI